MSQQNQTSQARRSQERNGPTLRVFAYRSGHLSFVEGAMGERGMATDGSLLVATGPANVVGPIVRGLARLAYDNETYLVPGLPEARENDEDAAYKAFMVWFERVQVALGKHGLGYGPAKRQRRARK